MIDWLTARVGMTFETLIVLTAAVAAAAMVAATWRALLWRDPIAARLQHLRKRQEELRLGMLAPRRREARRPTTQGVMQSVTTRLNLLRSQTAVNVTEKLARAGWRSQDALVKFLFFKLALPSLFGGGAVLVIHVLHIVALPPIAENAMPAVAVLVGFYAPDLHVKNAIARREQAVQKALPDALDLLVICAEAGLALDPALTRVSREMAQAAPEIADEIGLTAIELGFLPERAKALENLSRRCQLASVRGVVNTLMQTERFGTPLAKSLRVLAAEFRNERMMKAEEKAAKLPAILTLPLIVFIMPALIIVLLGPGILRIMDSMTRMH